MKKNLRIYLSAAVIFFFSGYKVLAQQEVDYRLWQSPVKNQGGRGTCTAFAIAAMLETLPGFPTDISEQHIYAWAKLDYYLKMPKTYDEGGSLAFYQDLLSRQGAVPEFKYPYDPESPVWKEGDENRIKMERDIKISFMDIFNLQRFSYKVKTTYLKDEKAQDVAFIKQLLNNGKHAIAVSYHVNDVYWSYKNGAQNNQITPWDFLQVKYNGKWLSDIERRLSLQDWIKLFYEDKVELIFKDPDLEINAGHAVTIVGYGKNGFLIKNSWGTEWGDQGYAWVSYDYHRLFARELLYVNDYEAAGWKPREGVKYASEDIQLKSLPVSNTDYFSGKKSNCISLSVVYTGNEVPPRFSSIVYKIYDSSNKLLDTRYGKTQGIFDGFLSGYETYAQCTPHPFKSDIVKLVAEFTLLNGQKFTQTYEQITGVNKQYRPVK